MIIKETTINEAVMLKSRAEHQIFQILKALNADTGLSVTDIKLTLVETFSGFHEVSDVSLEIKL